MIDAKLIRDNVDFVKTSLLNRGMDITLLDEFLIADKQWREALLSIDTLKMKRNQ